MTIYQALKEKLRREPTRDEMKKEVERSIHEASTVQLCAEREVLRWMLR